MNKNTTFYKKLMLNYNIISLIFIIVINFIFFNEIEKKNIEYAKENNMNILIKIENMINNMENISSRFIRNIYSRETLLQDTLYFLDNNLNDYLNYKLDRFSLTNLDYYRGIEYLIKETFDTESLIKNIEIISYRTNTAYSFDKKHKITTENIKLPLEPNVLHKIIVTKNISNPVNLEIWGQVKFELDTKKIDEILQKNDNNKVIILRPDGLVLYTSTQDNTYIKDMILNLDSNYKSKNKNIIEFNEKILLGSFKSVFILNNKALILNITIINIIFLILSQIFIFNKLSKVNYRLNGILKTMENIKDDGKLKRIPKEFYKEEDEISVICKNFNKMCDDIEEYIQRYYLAKISQKNAEMKMLQSQINPHFLYNVLESIRMKAIVNKDKDVAKMIYLVAHLFRNQLKEKNIITIKSELEYLSKFLEIHKLRYVDKIHYNVYCNDDLSKQEIMKFLLQPIIENYFMHAIRLQDNDNMINIKITKELNNIVIVIEDNGIGIEKTKLEEIRNKISSNTSEEEYTSIGLLNVNERIKMKYGNNYGLSIISQKDLGTKIIIKLPYIDN